MYMLGEKIIDKCGNKAVFLSMLKAKGYNIPLGVIVDFEEFKNLVRTQNLNFDNINELQIPDYIIDVILKVIPEDKSCAVRSSINIPGNTKENKIGEYTTFLNVARDRNSLKDKIKTTFLSLYSEENIKQYKRNNIDVGKVEMNIIVQEMIDSNASGILFSVNPTNGKDTEMVIEFSRGAGDTASGKTIPERIVYDWMTKEYIEEPKLNLLGDAVIKKIVNMALNLQQELGFPIDIEFGVYDSKLYIFELRPITKVEYKDVYYRYSALEDKNTILSPIMISLDLDVYNKVENEFAKEVMEMTDSEMMKPISFSSFSRVYWNISFIKKIFEKVPGYIERYIDEELKIRMDYLNNGVENLGEKNSKLKLFAKKNCLDILKKQTVDIEKYREKKIQELSNKKEELIDRIKDNIKAYMDAKAMYIWQQFSNEVYKINLNQKFGDILTRVEIRNLTKGVDNVYSTEPFLYVWDLSRKIKKDKETKKFFDDNLDAEIFYLYRKDSSNPFIKEFLTDYLEKYGYHSFNEGDIIYSTYSEEILRVVKMYRDMADIDDSYDPLEKLKYDNKQYELSIEKLKDELKPNAFKNAMKTIDMVRDSIKDEYALYDLTLITRSELRKSLLELAKKYKDEYLIDNLDDIFYLSYEQILNADNKENIKPIITNNKLYYNSFRNYRVQNEIFPCSKQQIEMDYRNKFQGIGASFGKTTARACVINSKEELKELKKGDVIVTSYIDKDIFEHLDFSQISGIVTEFGGMLCHFAVNARENRIPCVVGLKDATQLIRTGETLVINGDNGEVIL